jgi:hypothetical protein
MMLPMAMPSCEHVTLRLYLLMPHTLAELMLSHQTLDIGRRTIEIFLLGVRPQAGA